MRLNDGDVFTITKRALLFVPDLERALYVVVVDVCVFPAHFPKNTTEIPRHSDLGIERGLISSFPRPFDAVCCTHLYFDLQSDS